MPDQCAPRGCASIDKLEVYRGLGVRDVWIYRGTGFAVQRLEGRGLRRRYVADTRSRLVPCLDFDLLARFVPMKNQREAVAAFRAALGRAG